MCCRTMPGHITGMSVSLSDGRVSPRASEAASPGPVPRRGPWERGRAALGRRPESAGAISSLRRSASPAPLHASHARRQRGLGTTAGPVSQPYYQRDTN